MCSDHKVRTFITQVRWRAEMVRGKSQKSWIRPPSEQRETWLLARSNRHPFWYFYPDGLLAKSLRPARAEARFGSTHGLFSHVASVRITGQSPLVAWTTMNRRVSSWMRGDNQPVVPRPCKLEIPAACSPWSNQTMVTPSIFGRQWV